jgi:hypothetical protein
VGAARRTVAAAILEAAVAVAYAAPVAAADASSRAPAWGWLLLRAAGRGSLGFACACASHPHLLASRLCATPLLAGPAALALKHAPALANLADVADVATCGDAVPAGGAAAAEAERHAAATGGAPESRRRCRRRPWPLLAQFADALAHLLALASPLGGAADGGSRASASASASAGVLALRVPAATALVWLLAAPPLANARQRSGPGGAAAALLVRAAASPLYALFPGLLAPPLALLTLPPPPRFTLAVASDPAPGALASESAPCGLEPAARLAVCDALREFLLEDVGLGDPDLGAPPASASGGSAAAAASGAGSSAAESDANGCPEADAEPL